MSTKCVLSSEYDIIDATIYMGLFFFEMSFRTTCILSNQIGQIIARTFTVEFLQKDFKIAKLQKYHNFKSFKIVQ